MDRSTRCYILAFANAVCAIAAPTVLGFLGERIWPGCHAAAIGYYFSAIFLVVFLVGTTATLFATADSGCDKDHKRIPHK